jgi:hypothetical protein
MKKHLADKPYVGMLQMALAPMAFTLAIVSAFLELCNILNQYNIFIRNRTRLSLILYFIAFLVAIILFWSFRRKRTLKNFSWERLYYPGIILSLSTISVQPQLQMIVNTDLFESANGGTAISQFFLFGKLPVIESYSGHMLSDTIWGILYGVLNKDSFGAIFSPYSGYAFVAVIIIFYFILKNCFNQDFAFAMTVFFPFIGGQAIWSHIGFISVLALVYLIKSKSTNSYFIYWFVLAVSVLYQLDTGLAFGVGSLFALLTVCLFKRKEINFKKFIFSFLCVAVFFIGLFSFVCLVKNINIINRLREFMAIGLSNQNWAYSSLGDPKLFSFFYVYILIPILTITAFLLFILHIRNNSELSLNKIAIILTFGFSYLVNIPRILVRHNLLEGLTGTRLFTAALFIALVIPYLVRKNKYLLFSFSFFAVMVITSLISSNFNMYPQTLLSNTMNRFNNGALTIENTTTVKMNRVDTSDEMKGNYSAVVKQINKLLLPGETYLDFSNQTLLYALTGRENPTYISQSPGLISGEYSQTQFISQIEAVHDKVPLALLPKNPVYLGLSLDGMQNSYRYYKVAEYIYKNYSPLGIVGDYAIWCRNDKAQKYKLSSFVSPSISISKNMFDRLTAYDANIELNNGAVEITAGNTDPQLVGFENIIRDSMKNDMEAIIEIEYTSTVGGNVQLFYTRQKNEEFSEESSIRQTCQRQGLLDFKIPLTLFSRVRLDVPDGSKFSIKRVSLLNDGQFTSAGYDYADINEAHTYYIGAIPYLWGQYDVKKAYENRSIRDAIVTVNNGYRINDNTILKEKGNYFLLNITADKEGSVTIFFGSDNNDNFSTLNSYTFNVYKGRNNYLIRVSSDSYWYSKIINAFRLSLYEGVIVNEMQILEGD